MANYRYALHQATHYLNQHRITDADASARFLLADLLDTTPKQLYLKLDQPLTDAAAKQYQARLERRSHHEPVAYIIGKVNFCGRQLAIDNRALIPRPETEQLVQLVLDYSQTLPTTQPLTIVDVGTGSGAIALALTHAWLARPRTRVFGTDRSKTALHLAKHNKRLLNSGKILTFIEADLLQPTDRGFTWPTIDIIVANLPYIPSARIDQLDPAVKNFEPRLALDGGPDGRQFYRTLAEQLKGCLTQPKMIFLEIDETHHTIVLPGYQAKIVKDLAGLNRFAIFTNRQ